MSKELFMAAHEAGIEREMEETGCDYETAYDRTADAAYLRMRDMMADRIDAARDRAKYGDL